MDDAQLRLPGVPPGDAVSRETPSMHDTPAPPTTPARQPPRSDQSPATSTHSTAAPVIRVRILQLGRRVVEHTAPAGATLADTLAAAGFGSLPVGLDVRVNGTSALERHPLQDRDVVTLIPRIKGGQAKAGAEHR